MARAGNGARSQRPTGKAVLVVGGAGGEDQNVSQERATGTVARLPSAGADKRSLLLRRVRPHLLTFTYAALRHPQSLIPHRGRGWRHCLSAELLFRALGTYRRTLCPPVGS